MIHIWGPEYYCIRHIWTCIFRLVKVFHLKYVEQPKTVDIKGFHLKYKDQPKTVDIAGLHQMTGRQIGRQAAGCVWTVGRSMPR